MNRPTTIYLAALLISHAAPSYAQSKMWQSFPIPESIQVQQGMISTVPGWEPCSDPVDPRDHRPVSLEVYLGHPSGNGCLMADKSTKDKNTKFGTDTWSFGPNSDETFWVKIKYSATKLFLCKQLLKGVVEFRLTYNPNTTFQGHPVIIKAEYR